MGLKISVSVDAATGTAVLEQLKQLISQRTGQEPVVHVINSSIKFDNPGKSTYNSKRTSSTRSY